MPLVAADPLPSELEGCGPGGAVTMWLLHAAGLAAASAPFSTTVVFTASHRGGAALTPPYPSRAVVTRL